MDETIAILVRVVSFFNSQGNADRHGLPSAEAGIRQMVIDHLVKLKGAGHAIPAPTVRAINHETLEVEIEPLFR